MKELRRHVGRRVIVLLEESSIEGTLTRADAAVIELENARALTENAPPAPVDGTVVIPAGRIYWVQVP